MTLRLLITLILASTITTIGIPIRKYEMKCMIVYTVG